MLSISIWLNWVLSPSAHSICPSHPHPHVTILWPQCSPAFIKRFHIFFMVLPFFFISLISVFKVIHFHPVLIDRRKKSYKICKPMYRGKESPKKETFTVYSSVYVYIYIFIFIINPHLASWLPVNHYISLDCLCKQLQHYWWRWFDSRKGKQKRREEKMWGVFE